MFFSGHKLAIEVDEKGHTDRKKKHDKRQEKMQNKLDCKFIRVNHDGKDYDEYVQVK